MFLTLFQKLKFQCIQLLRISIPVEQKMFFGVLGGNENGI